jgi:hypothetical protein
MKFEDPFFKAAENMLRYQRSNDQIVFFNSDKKVWNPLHLVEHSLKRKYLETQIGGFAKVAVQRCYVKPEILAPFI